MTNSNFTWQTELAKNITTISQLKKYIKLNKSEEKKLRKVVDIHPLNITRYYLSLIDKKDSHDPIRKMIIPSSNELNVSGVYDTSGEAENTKSVGLQHKYAQTALILATNQCAAYCRFCFRKRLVGLSSAEILKNLTHSISYIRKHKEINNVLITGGDSLFLSTPLIKNFLEKLDSIKHLKFIRFGSRIPVTFPNRIIKDKLLLNIFKKYSRPQRRIYISSHFNHPHEITPQSIHAVELLLHSGIQLNNQTVLLKGVNDRPKILAELLNKLVSIGVSPYYIFQCRPVSRVKHHFQVSLSKGIEITETAKKYLNGYSKRFKYVMSHRSGKIEIIGVINNEIYFRYHQAKDPKNYNRFFKKKLNPDAGWLDDL